MNKVTRKQYCLQVMGITRWRLRQVADMPNLSKHPYLLLIGEQLNSEGQQLINRMLQALAWPIAETRIEKVEDSHLIPTFFYQKIKETQAEKVLLYGQALSQKLIHSTANPFLLPVDDKQIPIGILPTIQELLIDVAAKKRAWQVMQELGKIR